MTAYVLFGGAWLAGCGPPGDYGHDTYPVTFTALGERAHLASPQIDLDTAPLPDGPHRHFPSLSQNTQRDASSKRLYGSKLTGADTILEPTSGMLTLGIGTHRR
jgi:hypothetical protein